MEGLIFTYVWAFNEQSDWDYVDKVCSIFKSRGGTTYFVELDTDLDERLERNKSPLRLEHKPTKRNLEFSERDLLNSMKKYRLNSMDGEIKKENYMRINNTNISPEEAALMIKEKFKL